MGVKDKEIDIFGYSRGAIAAVKLAEKLAKETPPIKVRYMGLIERSVTYLKMDAPKIPKNVEEAWIYYVFGKSDQGASHIVADYFVVSHVELEEAVPGTIRKGTNSELGHFDAGKDKSAGHWVWPLPGRGLPLPAKNPY